VKPKARHRQRRKQRLVNRALDLGGLPRAELCDHVRVTGTGALEQVARSLAKPFARLQVTYKPWHCAVQREPCLDRGVVRQILAGAIGGGGPPCAKSARLLSALTSYDPAVVDLEPQIADLERAQAVSDHDAAAARHQPFHCLQDEGLGLEIDGAR